ncbi:MAG: sensor domain-containing protein [Mycobacterium sp.]|nr:sensor domain-containing protein [Mycobacterium sp.]
MSGKRVAGLLAAVGVLAGCAGAPVDTRPVVRIAEAAQPSKAIPLGRLLPSAQELSATLGTGPNGFMGQLVEGDDEMLLRSVGDAAAATPVDCVSTAYRLQKVVYDSGSVRSVASNSWAGGGFDGSPVSGFFGVVQMASAADAQKFFATIADKWRRCNGQTVALHHSGQGADELSRVVDVAFDRQVVSASVLHASGGTAAVGVSRALGVAGDCIVDVEITDPRAAGARQPAIGVAELILGKISQRR